MSIRSLLTLGLLAGSAIASPPGYGATSTETVTKTKTVTDTKTKTTTEHKTKTVTEKITKTTTDKITKTTTATVTKGTTAYSTITASASGYTTTVSGSCSAGSSSASSKPVTTSVSTTSSSSSTNTVPSTTIEATATATNYGPADAAKAAGKLFFGTAADIPGTGEAADPYYMAEFNNTHVFNEVTPANIMKYEFTEPEQGVFNFTGGDEFLAIVEPTKQYVRCHNLIWKSELPNWLTSPSTPWTNETLIPVLRNHVTRLIEYWGDKCYSWDVVNEAFADNPAGAYDNTSIWNQVIGPQYVVEAFDAATKAVKANNLAVKLYYNDYNIESPGAKATAALNLVKQLKGLGIQIDGVGFESHFIGGEAPSTASLVSNMQAFAAEGVDIVITELDVRINLPPTVASEQQQELDYYNTIKACVEVSQCIGMVVWDFDDTYSWVPGTFAGQGYADLFLQANGANTPLTAKSAYDGVLQALTGAAESSP